jgi:hypothetical protein
MWWCGLMHLELGWGDAGFARPLWPEASAKMGTTRRVGPCIRSRGSDRRRPEARANGITTTWLVICDRPKGTMQHFGGAVIDRVDVIPWAA